MTVRKAVRKKSCAELKGLWMLSSETLSSSMI